MEATPIVAQRISYSHFRTEDKHYFGGYLNLAQQNIDSVTEVLAERFHYNVPRSGLSGLLDTILSQNLSVPDYQRRIDFLGQYLPVVRYLDLSPNDERFAAYHGTDKEDKRREYLVENIKILLRVGNTLRNYYTHHYHKPISLDNPELYNLLDELFVKVTKHVRKQKMKNDSTRELLKKNLEEDLEILSQHKKDELKTKKAQGKKVSLDDESIRNGILNDAFHHLIYKEGKSEKVSARYKSYHIPTDKYELPVTISESGLLFLTGLFLSRRESEGMRSRVKGYKARIIRDPDKPITRENNGLKYMATHWIFGHLGYTGIKTRLQTGYDRTTLLIQIADELSKVPDEVYEVLSKKNQATFVEDINEYLSEGAQSASEKGALVVHPVIRKRYEDKFHYFVLRYLDEFVDFPTLTFQVHIGNYIHDRRTKSIEGTTYQTDRRVKEKVNVFGKLSTVSKLKAKYWTENGPSPSDTGWEEFPHPSYNTVGNNIPVFINLKKSTVTGSSQLYGNILKYRREIDNKSRNAGKSTKEEMVQLIHEEIDDNKLNSVYNLAPTALLSLNELPALIHELLVRKKTPEEIEEKLIRKLKEHFERIENYNPDSGGESPSRLSRNLLKSGSGKKLRVKKLKNAIRSEIKVSTKKLKQLEENRREAESKRSTRKYTYTGWEMGREATWLADDLKRFMPKEVREQWRGHHHSQLQESLAFYRHRPDEAKNLLGAFWNWKEDEYPWNDFIRKSFQKKNFAAFYRLYHLGRKKYYKSLLQGIKQNQEAKESLKRFFEQEQIWNLFHQRLYFRDDTESQKIKLLAQPLVFPRGIFDDKPTFIPGKKMKDDPGLFADWFQYAYRDDHKYQQFYDLPREYKAKYKEVREEHPGMIENRQELSPKQQLDWFRMKTDLGIKKIKTQDLFLNLITRDLYKKTFGQDIELFLSDFYLSQEERMEKDRRAREQSERVFGDDSENIINDKYLWGRTVLYRYKNLLEPAVKLKDIGKFKRFLTDEKVDILFQYDTEQKWTKREMEEELEIGPDSYEVIRREEVLKSIQSLESDILKDWEFDGEQEPPEFLQGEKQNPNFKLYLVHGILEKYDLVDEGDIEWFHSLGDSNFEKVPLEELSHKTEQVYKAYLLVLLRNKFAHNQLPHPRYFQFMQKRILLKKSRGETYCRYLSRVVEALISEFKNLMSAE
ncbi:type VI-B CRISPR-associated RNA-guided ribonuclease Cas13b [Membranihabitans maritimus]|uniref:type VI-B CRISPR-associated RNA-guided ribonuclease Cas13b n=1 Tax=Membranihabitans maritimus TaxID=2904244 RepID=UPI001F40D76A|nr:type VI-B CRISPR-associated RNA-guided ribonuclease Cas13b [Membranihabitans maritimus]